ncbi:serine/threonine-protein kinase [Streptomyces zhihengii]
MQRLQPGDPSHLGHYRLVGRLGEGGMGRVFLGRSAGGRTVAIKAIHAELAQVPDLRARFAREVEAARRVGGQWTAAVLDADVEAALPWVATQYVLGRSLYEVVAEDFGPLPERSLRVLANRLALALAAVHGAGLVHRDLKPSNVLVTVDGPCLIDFGIARAFEDAGTAAPGAPRTRTGMLVGSPGFMSPEQVRGREIGPASDVFCLGSVLAYAATGRQPFGVTGSEGHHAQLFRVVEDEPDLDGVPAALLGLVRACLEKDPGLRPGTDEVAERTAVPVGPWLPGRSWSSWDGGPGRYSTTTTRHPNRHPPIHPLRPPRRPGRVPHAPRAAARATRQPGSHRQMAFAPHGPGRRPGAGCRGRGAYLLTDGFRDAEGDGSEGTTAAPREFLGTWKGEFPKGAGAPEGYVRIEIADGAGRPAQVAVLDKTRLCRAGSGIEQAAQDENFAGHALTLGRARVDSATPAGEAGACWQPERSTLGFAGSGKDRMVWRVGGFEVQLTREGAHPSASTLPRGCGGATRTTRTWTRPHSSRWRGVQSTPPPSPSGTAWDRTRRATTRPGCSPPTNRNC